MTIKAIETKYKGYRFRSRLEARWAVFFDALGIQWEYEKEGYQLSTGERYLPDFWLANVGVRGGQKGMFAEVKGENATEIEIHKLAQVASKFGVAAMLQGGIGDHPQWNEFLEVGWDERHSEHWYDVPMAFMKCYSCGDIKFEFLESNYCVCNICGRVADESHPAILKAYETARSARFEYGESG